MTGDKSNASCQRNTGLATAVFQSAVVNAGSFLLAALITQAAVAGDSSDRRFLDGLRERGLFQLAEKYCRDRLAETDLAPERRAELVIGLSRSLAQRAAGSPPEERPALWRQAPQVVHRFAQRHPQDSRLLLVRLQGALGLLARGELVRQEGQLVADNRLFVNEARTQLRTAIGQLHELAGEVGTRLQGRNRPGGPATGRGQSDRPSHQLTAHELASLQKNIQYQLARALRNQGQCYGSDSSDRANSLTQAVRLLDLLAGLDSTDPLSWKSRIDQIVCYRLLADYPTAGQKLDTLFQQKPPPEIALRARAEQIRLALATGRLSDAIAALEKGTRFNLPERPGGCFAQIKPGPFFGSAELDYAHLETYLAAWRGATEAKDSQQAGKWEKKATEMVRLIERLHGPYWARRAEMLLAGYVRTSPETGDLETLVRAAESSYRSGRFDDATVAYDRARVLASKNGAAARAFQLGYVAATIEHRRNRHPQALERYRQLALSMPDQTKAPEAHLLAIHHASRLAKQQSPGSLDQYTALLHEHLDKWPTDASADRARWQLGRLYQHQRDWQGAIAAYRDISPNDPEYSKAVATTGQCYEAWLAKRKAAGEPTDKIATEAAGWFESLTIGPQRRLPECWSQRARQRLDRINARALADAGRTDEALEQYVSLSKKFPHDDQLQEAHAELLSSRQDRASLEAALSKWRELEKRLPSGSDRWFRAKYSVALLHYRLGNRKQAAKIVTLLKVLHPELGGPAMKRQFVELLRCCEGPGK